MDVLLMIMEIEVVIKLLVDLAWKKLVVVVVLEIVAMGDLQRCWEGLLRRGLLQMVDTKIDCQKKNTAQAEKTKMAFLNILQNQHFTFYTVVMYRS